MKGKRLYHAMAAILRPNEERANYHFYGLFASEQEAEGTAIARARTAEKWNGPIQTSCAYLIPDALVLEAAAIIRQEGGAA